MQVQIHLDDAGLYSCDHFPNSVKKNSLDFIMKSAKHKEEGVVLRNKSVKKEISTHRVELALGI